MWEPVPPLHLVSEVPLRLTRGQAPKDGRRASLAGPLGPFYPLGRVIPANDVELPTLQWNHHLAFMPKQGTNRSWGPGGKNSHHSSSDPSLHTLCWHWFNPQGQVPRIHPGILVLQLFFSALSHPGSNPKVPTSVSNLGWFELMIYLTSWWCQGNTNSLETALLILNLDLFLLSYIWFYPLSRCWVNSTIMKGNNNTAMYCVPSTFCTRVFNKLHETVNKLSVRWSLQTAGQR